MNLDYGNPYGADSTQQVELGWACLGREQNHGKGASFFGFGQPGLKACSLASLGGEVLGNVAHQYHHRLWLDLLPVVLSAQ